MAVLVRKADIDESVDDENVDVTSLSRDGSFGGVVGLLFERFRVGGLLLGELL